MKKTMVLVVSVSLIYLLVCIWLYIVQRNLLYFPTPDYSHSFHELILKNNHETIEILVLNEGKSNAILYFGGNAESVIQTASDYATDFPNHSVYMFSYRGYGGSSGAPTEANIYADALLAFDTLSTKHDKISVVGRSLGTGVSTYIASQRTVDKLALITPFDSITQIARGKYPIIPVNWLLKDRYDSVSRASKILSPVLVILAENDALIPIQNSMKLINALDSTQVTVEVIPNTGHVNISHQTQYHHLLSVFMKEEYSDR